ncbi:MAG: C40 family peptidase [Chitinophagaceae bacterium]|nr:C40 family peptidase [Chitinophagaceae bacterium]
MKKKDFLIFIGLLLIFSSCRSFRQLSSKDNAVASNTVRKKANTGKKTEFLDNIEVTPGTAVTTKHKSSTAYTAVAKDNLVGSDTKFALQDAGYLQLKFSVLIGVPVEDLSNIPLLNEMDRWWGTKYCMGGVSENCLDCSAFTQIMMRDVFHVNLPRTAQEQYDASMKVRSANLQEGDLVFFHTAGRSRKNITHVGVYLQNNKFVHAATSGGVMISDLNEKYWEPKFRGGGRIK